MAIVQWFSEGGVFMYVILMFGIATISLIIERAISLYYSIKPIRPEFRDEILEYIEKGDFVGAEQHALRSKGTHAGEIIATGCHIRANAGGEEELQARMDEKLASEISNIDRRTGFLGMCGNVVTLVGLLGTITGMIRSFAAVAESSPVDRATMLSKGISEAMNCTAFALCVAIPALVAYAFFQNKTDRIVGKITELTTQVFHDLLFLTEGSSTVSEQKASRPIARTHTSRISSDVATHV